MITPVISATGLWTPAQSVSNAELVESYNAWADKWNAEHAAEIEAGTAEAKTHSSVEFIEKASGIKSRFVVDKAGIIDPDVMRPNIPERPNEEISVLAEIAVNAARMALERAGRDRKMSTPCYARPRTCSGAIRPWRWRSRMRSALTGSDLT